MNVFKNGKLVLSGKKTTGLYILDGFRRNDSHFAMPSVPGNNALKWHL